MSSFSPRRPSASLVISITALVVALGGTSYAAVVLPRNSVGSRQIKPRAVKASDLATGAVTSAKVKDRSLMSKDFKLGQLAAGRTGDTGARGTIGPSDVYTGAAEAGANPRVVTVDVPAGTYSVTAKAVFVGSGGSATVAIQCALNPSDDGTATTDASAATLTASDWTTLANVVTKTFPAPGTFTYVCGNILMTSGGTFHNVVVVATKVGARH